MLNKSVILIVLAVTMILSTGCGPREVKVTTAENGGQIEVKAGDQFVVELEGNPSTGYTWEARDLDTNMFQQIGDAEFTSGDPGLVGAGGTLALTFKAIQAGTGTLTLVYHRSWEPDVAPADTFTVTVIVK